MKYHYTFSVTMITGILILLATLAFTKPNQPTVNHPPPTPTPIIHATLRPTPNPVKYIGKFEITAYTHTEPGCDKWTATSKHVNKKYVSAPDRFPFGTKLKIEGIGIVWVQDRGGAVHGNVIDRYLPTEAECWKWGRGGKPRKVWVMK